MSPADPTVGGPFSVDPSQSSPYALAAQLYPICRSISGDGVRRSLETLRRLVPLQVEEVPSGTRVLDWDVPPEWNVREAYVAAPDGTRLIDLADHNLHLMSYSEPVRGRFSRDELLARVHTLPDQPDWIPYRTSYYARNWGFCTRHRDLSRFTHDHYDVVVDTTLEPGNLTYGELLVPGESEREVLVYSHICHPSLANDNATGVAVSAFLARAVMGAPRRLSYRFVWAPGTIGSITWLARNRERLRRIQHGLVLTCLGDAGGFCYKPTESGGARIDQIMTQLITPLGGEVLPFEPYGYDERQFGSPGFRLPVGRLTRTPNGQYPEYHTSADDLGFISAEQLDGSLALCERLVAALEADRCYLNLEPHGEPQLGRRGLYRATGGVHTTDWQMAMLWVLNQSDGTHSLFDISTRSGLELATIEAVAHELETAGLLRALERPTEQDPDHG